MKPITPDSVAFLARRASFWAFPTKRSPRPLISPWFLGGRQDLGYLFPSAVSSNGRLGGDAILRRFKKRSRKMPCGEFGCHDVRRHVASAMMRKNGEERAVAAMLQHESVGTVGTYARLRDAAAASRAMRDANRAIYQGLERNRVRKPRRAISGKRHKIRLEGSARSELNRLRSKT